MNELPIWMATLPWNDGSDLRPCVQLDQQGPDTFGCFPVSTKCYTGMHCFPVNSDDPDFSATGLDKDCFVHYESILTLKIDDMKERIGFLAGDLLARFRTEAGL